MPGENLGLRVFIWKVPNSMLERRKNKVWSSWGPGQLHGHANHLLLGGGGHFCKFKGTLDATGLSQTLRDSQQWEHTAV